MLRQEGDWALCLAMGAAEEEGVAVKSITAQERRACLDILQDILSQVRAQSDVLQGDLNACKE